MPDRRDTSRITHALVDTEGRLARGGYCVKIGAAPSLAMGR